MTQAVVTETRETLEALCERIQRWDDDGGQIVPATPVTLVTLAPTTKASKVAHKDAVQTRRDVSVSSRSQADL